MKIRADENSDMKIQTRRYVINKYLKMTGTPKYSYNNF